MIMSSMLQGERECTIVDIAVAGYKRNVERRMRRLQNIRSLKEKLQGYGT